MGRSQREKGKRYERKSAALWRAIGVRAHRGQQYSGRGADDVVALPGCHHEVKARKSMAVAPLWTQAVEEAGDRLPILELFWNGGPGLICVRHQDLREFAAALHEALTNGGEPDAP